MSKSEFEFEFEQPPTESSPTSTAANAGAPKSDGRNGPKSPATTPTLLSDKSPPQNPDLGDVIEEFIELDDKGP